MYIPKSFEIKDTEVIYDMIEKYSFAAMFSQHNGGPYATHLPLTLDREKGILYGHIARQNTQWKDIEDHEVLAIFQGPHSYISPSWYETKTAVPTWNYVAVHVYGRVEMMESDQELMDTLRDLVRKYERPDSLYNLDEVEPSYVEALSKGIVGFKIKITRVEGKQKLSQNHSLERQDLVIGQLEQIPSEDSHKIAQLMKKQQG
ncbi:FMN-binding negative transcriptional regulator [Bacillus sp. DJP31]|uniref:FMN-binding negative transcriptional regulator n=1 Tax=Bacillus sp. DJP31 TaxID=3409789 RepID=UPI003BB4E09D